MPASATIKAIILNYNSAPDTIELYRQLVSFHLTNLHVLIIDNASEQSDQDLLISSIPNEQLLLNSTNLGYAGGNNIGINLALQEGYQYSLLLNPDIRLTQSTIPQLLNIAEQTENLAAIGPRIAYRNDPEKIYSDGGLVDREQGYLTNHIHYGMYTNEINKEPMLQQVDYVNGSCILMNNEVIKKIGSLNDDFFLYFEETEWCLRAKRYGYVCLNNAHALTYHSSSQKSKLYYYYMVRNRIILAKIEGKYYRLTRNRILKNLMKECVNQLTKGTKAPFWWTRLKGLLSGIYYSVN